jgi:hypothetical protein
VISEGDIVMFDFGMRRGIRVLRGAVLTAFLLLTVTAAAQATPLDVPLDQYPVILVGFLQIDYFAATDAFTATGWAQSINKNGTPTSFLNPFSLGATIDSSGHASNGWFSVGNGGSLLGSLNLLEFGFDATPGGALEFLFSAPTGSLAETQPVVYAPKPVDVMFYSVGSAFKGTWTEDWSSDFKATAEIRSDDPRPVPAPEPSTLLLLLVGLGGAGLSVRRLA